MSSQSNLDFSMPSSSSSEHHRRRRHRRRVSPVLVAVIAVGVFACITAGSAFAFTTMIEQGRMNLLALQDAEVATVKEAETEDKGKTVTYNGQKYKLNEDIVSLCLIGHDKDFAAPEEDFNGQADAIVVVALDTNTGNMSGIVVPRDSMVDVDVNYLGTNELYDTETMQLCLAYAYGTDDAASSELVCRAVSRILYNIPITYYYTISMAGVVALADEVGGVALEALQSIPNTDIEQGQTVKLSGDDAVRYIRYRNLNEYGSDLDRQDRQMQFVRAVAAKVLTVAKGNPAALVNVYNTLSGYSTSNIGASEISYLASTIAKGSGDFNLVSLQGTPVHDENSQWEQFILDKNSVYQTVLDVYYEKAD